MEGLREPQCSQRCSSFVENRPRTTFIGCQPGTKGTRECDDPRRSFLQIPIFKHGAEGIEPLTSAMQGRYEGFALVRKCSKFAPNQHILQQTSPYLFPGVW